MEKLPSDREEFKGNDDYDKELALNMIKLSGLTPFEDIEVKENALELLDEENEFYLDMAEDVVYYKPKAGVDITLSEIFAPAQEELFVFSGSGLYQKVKNIPGITIYGDFSVKDLGFVRF